MKKTVFLIIVMAFGLLGTQAMAQRLPSYYPAEFPDVGVIDGVSLGKGKIRIDDSVYQISPQAVVRSLSSKQDSMSRLRIGANVGFLSRNGVIVEFWLLPANYD